MKASFGIGAFAAVLLLAGCGREDGAITAANESAPLETIPAPNNGDWTEMVEQTPEGGYRMGNPDAPVKLVEFASMTCPHCATFSEQASEPLRERYIRTGQVSLEFRNFVLNPADAAASMLARCQPDAAFFRITEQLFATQQEWIGNLDDAEARQISALAPNQQIPAYARALELDSFFARRGMPQARFEQCVNDQQALERLAATTQQAANEHNITGTPSFMINGQPQNVTSWPELEPRLRAALRR